MIDSQRDPLELDPVILLTENVARLVEQVSALVDQLGGPPAPQLMTCAQVAEQLGVVPTWVQAAARDGRISHRKLGSKYRFTQADVDEMIERARRVGRDP